jgi:colanic acid/amylovoran biosynthesis glycosyltransferase
MYHWEVRDMLLVLARIDAKVLHIYFGNVAPQFIPLLKVWRHPTVVSFHGADAAVDMDKPRYRAAMQEVFNLATKVQARSEALASDLVALGCPPEKIVVHRTGIPLDQWPFVERVPPMDGAWHLVQSCRFIEKKGLDLTLQTFAAVSKQFPNATLTLIGDGPLRAELEKQAGELGVQGRVMFTGFLRQDEMKPIINCAHIFMQPSRTGKDGNREGVPNAMLEAMASGTAVIATRHGGIPEAVTHEVTGLLVAEDDGDALTAATLRVMEDPSLAMRLGREASLAVTTNFRRDTQDTKLAAFYQALIATHSA